MDVRDNCFERNRYETEAYSSKMWWLCSERKYSVSFHAAARISFCAFEAACVSSPLLSGEHCISQFRNRRPSIWRDLCAPEMLLWYSISQTHRGFRDKQRRRRSANFDTADRLAFERSNTHPAYYGGYAIALSKQWGESHGLQPVQYANGMSDFTNSLSEVINSAYEADDLPDLYVNDILRRLSFIKPLRGLMRRRFQDTWINVQKNFHDEREWRFVLPQSALDALQFDSVIANPKKLRMMEVWLGSTDILNVKRHVLRGWSSHSTIFDIWSSPRFRLESNWLKRFWHFLQKAFPPANQRTSAKACWSAKYLYWTKSERTGSYGPK